MTYICVGVGIVVLLFLIAFGWGLCKVAGDSDDRMGTR